MFPFLNHNGYPIPPFPFNAGYETFRQPPNDVNPYIYHYVSPNFPLQHQSPIPNHFQPQQMPYFFQGKNPHDQNAQPELRKKKRITKKIGLTEVKKKIRASYPHFKAKKNTFKYLDPSRAPPITSLRNQQELQMDLALQQQKRDDSSSHLQKQNLSTSQAQSKLQILLEQPDPLNYPFLICKKRKYHRNLKRRYSVAYFEQRAVYIVNKEPIPPSLHPKNKVRKPRTPKNNVQQLSGSSSNQFSSESFSSQSESIEKPERSKKANDITVKAENKHPFGIKLMKQENESSSPLEEAEF